MPVSFAPVATLVVTRPAPQCDGKMPYSALSLVLERSMLQSSTQRRKIPSSSNPFTVRPRIRLPVMRSAALPMQVEPEAPERATSMPRSCPPGSR
jgi:hypothetical protein